MIVTLIDTIAAVGALFILLSSVGLLRFPDVYCRMHASTKASSFGIGCILFAGAIHFGTADVICKVLAIGSFIFLTAPIGAHILSRAALVRKIGSSQS